SSDGWLGGATSRTPPATPAKPRPGSPPRPLQWPHLMPTSWFAQQWSESLPEPVPLDCFLQPRFASPSPLAQWLPRGGQFAADCYQGWFALPLLVLWLVILQWQPVQRVWLHPVL